MLVVHTIDIAGVLGGQLRGLTFPGLLGIAVVAVSLLGSGWGLLTGRHRAWPEVVTGAAVLGIAAAASELPTDPEMTRATWWPMHVLLSVAMYVALATTGRRRTALLAVLGVTWAALRAATLPGGWHPEAGLVRQFALEAGQLGYLIATMIVVTHVFGGTARRADDALAVERRLRAQNAVRRDAARAERAADRFLHDEVLHTLRAIATPGRAEPGTIRDLAGSLAGALTQESPDAGLTGESPLVARLQEVAARADVAVWLSGRARILLPQEVADTLVSATEEALRNVARHAGVDRARVRVARRGLEVRVVVSDRGRGFPADHAQWRHGLAGSIVAAMRDIGGTAEVESTPGRGTTVTLSWAPYATGISSPIPTAALPGAPSQVYADVARCFFPLLALVAWNTLWTASATTAPLVNATASVGVLLVSLALVRWAPARGISGAQSAALTLVAWGASAINGATLPAGSGDAYLYWLAGGACLLSLFQSIYRPLREGLTTGLGLTLVALVLSIRATEGTYWAPFLPCVASALVGTVNGAVTRYGIDRLAWRILKAEEEADRALARESTLEEVRRVVAERMRWRRSAVLGFVEAVADGRVSSEDPDVRRQADELERTVREETLGGLGAPLRLAVIACRAAGLRLVLRTRPGAPLPAQEHARVCLLMVAELARRGRIDGVTLTMSPAGWGVGEGAATWRVGAYVATTDAGVVGDLVARCGAGGWRITTDASGVRLTSRTPVTDPVTVLSHGGHAPRPQPAVEPAPPPEVGHGPGVGRPGRPGHEARVDEGSARP